MHFSEKWQKLIAAVGCYMCIKPIFNCLLLGGDLKPLLYGVLALIAMWSGVKYSNLVTALLLALVALTNLPHNLGSIGLNAYLIYTLEGVVDVLLAALLTFHPAVREHCRQS